MSEGKEKHPWLVFSGPGHDKEEKLKKERKKNRNEEGEVLSFAQGTRSMFRKNENERMKRERGGIQNCGYIPFVASPALSASSLELFSKRFIQSRVWEKMFDGKSLNTKNNTIEEYK